MTLHILDSDLYFELEFTSWSEIGGGFSYIRTWILPEGCEEFALIYGCTDATAINYSDIATIDDGSCISSVEGCTNPDAYNYNPEAAIDDGTCTILDCNYDGPAVVEFVKENYADWTLPENRDLITETCEITRQDNQAPFNYVYQDSYWDNQEGSNIEWKQGAYDEPGDYFSAISEAFGGQMSGLVGETATLHVIDSDLYFEILFTSFTGGNNGGGFAYTRTWVDGGCEEILLVEGCDDEMACNYDPSANTNDGSCEYVSCADECGVPNGDNSSCADECGVPNGDNSTCSGCTDPQAYNYNPEAAIDDGTCTILDCNYDGPAVVEFVKENYADWTLPENRDLITETCEITRQDNQAPFNYVYQDSYWDNQEGSNIEWKQGAYDEPGDYFSAISEAFGGQMSGLVGETATLHVIDSDLYFEILFTSFTGGNNGGGFAYTRTWVDGGCEEILLVEGCDDEMACNYDPSANTNDGSCEYVSCADECGVPNGDNSSCADECGVPNGDNSTCLDECGVPNGDNSTCLECGVPNGDSTCLDECGVPNGDNSTCLDECGVPNGDNSTCLDYVVFLMEITQLV